MPFDETSWRLPKVKVQLMTRESHHLLTRRRVSMTQAWRKMLAELASSFTSTAPPATKCSEMLKSSAGGNSSLETDLYEILDDSLETEPESTLNHHKIFMSTFSQSPNVYRMVHRGASAADNASGDGAGVLLGLPHSYYCDILKYAKCFSA